MSNINKMMNYSLYFQEIPCEEAATINGGNITLFDGLDFKGDSRNFTSSPINNLGLNGFDNKTESVTNDDSRPWQLFEQPNLRGRFVIVNPGASVRVGNPNTISSIRRI